MKQGKINTEKMIANIIVDKGTSSVTLNQLKDDRDVDNLGSNRVVLEKDETAKQVDKKREHANKGGISNEESKLWVRLTQTLEARHFNDKKEPFLMSLSGDCLQGYEKIANGITYKTDKKVSRNTVIRKILEDYLYKNSTRLENIIVKL